jgi:PBP1b-binding outer membrane lipoprotein LpoB
MRVNKWGVGVILAAAVLLTGCSAGASDKPADSKPSSGASQEAEAPKTDCPELKEGATVDGGTLAECVTAAMTDTAGFAAKMTTMGMESDSLYNPADGAVQTNTPFGSIIVIGDDAWVKSSTGEWQVADTSSTDQEVLALSTAAKAADPSDPMGVATTLAGEYTVTGKSTRLGQDVFLLSGTSESQGTSVAMLFELTSDYVVLAATASTEVEGQKIESVQEVTEWDVKQDIVAPL